MLVTFVILILLAAGLGGIAYGIHAIGAELRGIEGDEAKRRGAEDAKEIAAMKKTLEKWRAGK